MPRSQDRRHDAPASSIAAAGDPGEAVAFSRSAGAAAPGGADPPASAGRLEQRALKAGPRAGAGRAGVMVARLSFIMTAILLAVLCGEVAARVLPPKATTLGDDGSDPNDGLWSDPEWRSPPPRTFRFDPVLAFDNAPSSVADVPMGEHPRRRYRFKTNEYGLRRDTEIAITPPPGTFRVLVLGDSQTGGFVDNAQTYSHLLEDRWGRETGRAVEVLNAGVIGYAPQQEYLWYLQRGRQLHPDLVILTLYVGNDVRDLVDGEVDAAVVDDEAGTIGPLTAPGAWISLHSAMAKLAYGAARGAPTLRDGLRAGGLRAPAPPSADSTDGLVRLLRECHGCWLQSLKQATRARHDPAAFGDAYRRLAVLIGLLDRHVRADGAQLAVVILPTKTQVEPADERGALTRATRLLALEPADLAYDDLARDAVLAAARSAGARIVDPLTPMGEAARGGRLYYRRDWHLNIRGNDVLAAILADDLADIAASHSAGLRR